MAARIYVGNLPIDIKESEIDDLFYKYGKITDIDLKTPARPPAFAFVSFRDVRDAEDAIRGRDNYTFDGYRLRCEFAKGDRRDGGRGDDRRDDRPRGRTGGRRTDYGVIVTNLPQGTSWQDLKDHMRKAGDVVFTDVDRHGDGVVEFSNRSDMEHAVRKLDDTELKTRNNDTSYIRVKLAKSARDRSEDGRDSRKDKKRSPSRSRSVSRSRSPARRSRSHSRSRSNSADSASRKRKSSEDDIKPLSASSADAAVAVAEVTPADEEAK